MKVAVLSESEADELAVRMLIDGILGKQSSPVPMPRLRTRGWPSVLQYLPNVLMHLHYRTDVEALALVVDSDLSPIHLPAHNQPDGANLQCRLCQLRQNLG